MMSITQPPRAYAAFKTMQVTQPQTQVTRFQAASAPMQVDPQRLRNDVTVLTRLLRNPEHMDQLNQAADHIKSEWQKLGLQVEEQPFQVNGRTFRNLVVSFGPPDAERFIIGAHYDVVGDQPGADDNASGVAGMLELSRLMSKNKPKLTKRLDLVAYTLEEQPYAVLGSRMHAQKMIDEKIPVKGMISLEMIGYYSDQKGSQTFPSKIMSWFYPDKANFIALVGYGKSFGIMRRTGKAFSQFSSIAAKKLYIPVNRFGMDRSDHSPYANAGIPAFMITDTAEFRNKNYHQVTDTIHTLNFDKMAEVVKGVYGMAQGL